MDLAVYIFAAIGVVAVLFVVAFAGAAWGYYKGHGEADNKWKKKWADYVADHTPKPPPHEHSWVVLSIQGSPDNKKAGHAPRSFALRQCKDCGTTDSIQVAGDWTPTDLKPITQEDRAVMVTELQDTLRTLEHQDQEDQDQPT